MAAIRLRRSSTPGEVPASLVDGEPAINLADDRLRIGGGAPNGYPLGAAPWVTRRGSAVAHDLQSALQNVPASTATMSFGVSRFVPFVWPRRFALERLGVAISVSRSGTLGLAIYDSIQLNGGDWPGNRLALASLAVSSGELSALVSLDIAPGRLYWAAQLFSATGVRARAITQSMPLLGRLPGYAAVQNLATSEAGLTDPAPTTLIPSTTPGALMLAWVA